MQAIKNPLQERAFGKVFMSKASLAIQKTEGKLCVQALTTCSLSEHTLAVGRKYQHTAKFWDYYPLRRRQHRPSDHGGFFMPVSHVPSCGYLPGVRGLQHGIIRNKRVALRRGDSSTRQFLPTTKTFVGVIAMTAIQSMGNHARAFFARLPSMHPVSVGGAV
jgi:hypothetical protein